MGASYKKIWREKSLQDFLNQEILWLIIERTFHGKVKECIELKELNDYFFQYESLSQKGTSISTK